LVPTAAVFQRNASTQASGDCISWSQFDSIRQVANLIRSFVIPLRLELTEINELDNGRRIKKFDTSRVNVNKSGAK